MKKFEKYFLSIIALFAWIAFFISFPVGFKLDTTSEDGSVFLNILSFFTIQTNLLIALISSYLLISKKKNLPKILEFGSTLNITVTVLVYVSLIAPTWEPTGIELIADLTSHYIVPFLYIIFMFFVNKNKWEYKWIILWFNYSSIYLFVILLRGHFTNFYPYDFLKYSQLTTQQLLINCISMGIFIVLVSGILVWAKNIVANVKTT